MRFYNRVVLMHRKQIWQPWVYQVFDDAFVYQRSTCVVSGPIDVELRHGTCSTRRLGNSVRCVL